MSFSALTRDTITSVLCYMPASHCISLSSVCKKWHAAIERAEFWQMLHKVQNIPLNGVVGLFSLKESALTLRGVAWFTDDASFKDVGVLENNVRTTATCIKIEAEFMSEEFPAPKPFWFPVKYFYDPESGDSLKDTGDCFKLKYHNRLTQLTIQPKSKDNNNEKNKGPISFAQELRRRIDLKVDESFYKDFHCTTKTQPMPAGSIVSIKI